MTIDWQDTIASPASSRALGSGAQGIIRLCGPRAFEVIASLLEVREPCAKDPEPTTTTRAAPGTPARESFSIHREGDPRASVTAPLALPRWDWARLAIEEQLSAPVKLYRWPEGSGATGQATVEIHHPASPVLADKIMERLIAAGVRQARPGEFTLRAFLAGRLDLAQAEGVLGLVESRTMDELRAALDQRSGGVSQSLVALRSSLIDLLADIEVNLDFVHEDVNGFDEEDGDRRLSRALQEQERLLASMGSRAVSHEVHRVVLSGKPNAGKSTLFNALVGDDVALVSARAGTTLDRVVRTLSSEGGAFELVDTAGGEPTTSEIHSQAQSQRLQCLDDADLVLHCVEASEWGAIALPSDPRMLVVGTKADMRPSIDPDSAADSAADSVGTGEVIFVSALTSRGIDELRAAIAERLRCREVGGMKTDITQRLRSALTRSIAMIEEARTQLRARDGLECVAFLIREAAHELGEVLGLNYSEELLDRVFSRFCIGK